jgi:hypothetical protein
VSDTGAACSGANVLLALNAAAFPSFRRSRPTIPVRQRAGQGFMLMIASRPIDVAGRFVGVAVSHITGWRFRAVDPVVDDLDGATFDSLAEAARVARVVAARTLDWARASACSH